MHMSDFLRLKFSLFFCLTSLTEAVLWTLISALNLEMNNYGHHIYVSIYTV